MLIRQEETSPVQDSFDKLKLSVAFAGIEKITSSNAVDSDLLITYCEETEKLLKDFRLSVENIVKKIQKTSNKQKFAEMLHGHDALGD